MDCGSSIEQSALFAWHGLAQQTLVCCPFLGKQKVTGAARE